MAFVEEFREYLRIDTRQPKPNYKEAVKFLKEKCESYLGASYVVKEYVEGKPILIATIKGTNPKLKSLVLSSHMDVVPTADNKWTLPPMAATLVDGKIYARGAQDMKCVGMAYIHALSKISKGFQRTVHLIFTPDEEIGSKDGMTLLVADEATWSSLNVGFALDEGVPSPVDKFFVFNRERGLMWMRGTIRGPAGHGSTLMTGTAAQKLTHAVCIIEEFRQGQLLKLAKAEGRLGQVTSINLNGVRCDSVQVNVVPSQFVLDIDVRVGPDFPSEQAFFRFFSNTLGKDVELEFIHRDDSLQFISDNAQILNTLTSVLGDLEVAVFPGGTDSRNIRAKGVPVFGISPFKNTPILIHDHDEYLGVDEYLAGVSRYEKLISFFVNNELEKIDF